MLVTLASGSKLSNQPAQTIPDLSVSDALVCPLCESTDVETYGSDNSNNNEPKLTAADLGSSRKNTSHGRIVRCRACRFGFRANRPAEEELSALYRQLDPLVYEKEALGRSKTARRHLRIVEHYVQAGRLLDVGCASGAFLRCASDAGWTVTGVEPAEALWAKAKQQMGEQSDVLCATLQGANLNPASFDVLTVWDVLEHVPDPLSFMRHCVSLLKPGGYLFANVPDLDSVQARLFRNRWPLLLAEHLNYFNRKSLQLCGEMAGLRWMGFGQRPASFSLEYLFYRLAQHGVPIASLGHAVVRKTFLSEISIPVFLGEIHGAWMRPIPK